MSGTTENIPHRILFSRIPRDITDLISLLLHFSHCSRHRNMSFRSLFCMHGYEHNKCFPFSNRKCQLQNTLSKHAVLALPSVIEHHAVLIIHTYNYLHLSFSPFFCLLYASCFPRNQSKRQLLHPGPQIGTPDCQRVDNHRSYTHRHRFSFFYQPAHIVYDIKIAILISQIHHHMSRKI